MDIYLSPSSLQRWFECKCPAAWQFGKQWELKEPNEIAERGTLVHALMDGSKKVSRVKDTYALNLYHKLVAAQEQLGLTFIHREETEKFEITLADFPHHIFWTRRIDGEATLPDGTHVIVDYKTTMVTWRTLADGVAPQARASQSVGYLYPNPDREPGPQSILYLLAPLRGDPTYHRYDLTEVDVWNFENMLRVAAAGVVNGTFPKVAGKHCIGNSTLPGCDFVGVCWQQKGWKKTLKARKVHHAID